MKKHNRILIKIVLRVLLTILLIVLPFLIVQPESVVDNPFLILNVVLQIVLAAIHLSSLIKKYRTAKYNYMSDEQFLLLCFGRDILEKTIRFYQQKKEINEWVENIKKTKNN